MQCRLGIQAENTLELVVFARDLRGLPSFFDIFGEFPQFLDEIGVAMGFVGVLH